MAAKTSVFYLTERITLDASTTQVSDTIDLGAYVDVADRQGILVHAVDFIVSPQNPADTLQNMFGGNTNVVAQLMDLNRGELVFPDDRALVASMRLSYDTDGFMSRDSDLYPDNFGPTSAQGGRIVINDQMYFRGVVNALASGKAVNVTVRIKCSVISLSQKDFMAIALQSTAADN
jgi:hypothetical protein